jgi:hypothetical protein
MDNKFAMSQFKIFALPRDLRRQSASYHALSGMIACNSTNHISNVPIVVVWNSSGVSPSHWMCTVASEPVNVIGAAVAAVDHFVALLTLIAVGENGF